MGERESFFEVEQEQDMLIGRCGKNLKGSNWRKENRPLAFSREREVAVVMEPGGREVPNSTKGIVPYYYFYLCKL